MIIKFGILIALIGYSDILCFENFGNGGDELSSYSFAESGASSSSSASTAHASSHSSAIVTNNNCDRPVRPFCGPNEVRDNCINGGCGRRNCTQLGSPRVCIDVLPEYCIKGCRCKDNYLRDKHGKCIPITKCPKPKCKKHEVFDFCPGNCLPDCDLDLAATSCLPSPKPGDPKCEPSCRCADNLYRTRAGTCVPKEKCPPKCPNDEVYEKCPSCIPNTCASIWTRYKPCDPDYVCTPTCLCPPGKFRSKIGECITAEECQKCRGPNEYFTCGGVCDNDCNNLSRQNQTSCPYVNIVCNRKCYCDDGYARDPYNNCVPYAECPPECPDNERYYYNVNTECRPQSCSELDRPLKRAECDCRGRGPPGCLCIEGFVRNDDGVCIPKDNCYASIYY